MGCPSLISGPGLAVIEVSKLDGKSLASDFEKNKGAASVLSTADHGTMRFNAFYEISGNEAERALELRHAETGEMEEWREVVLGRISGDNDTPGAAATIIWHETDGSARGLLLVEG